MSVAASIPRVSLGWLLLAQALVLLPLWFHVPLWMLGLWLGVTLARCVSFRRLAGPRGLASKRVVRRMRGARYGGYRYFACAWATRVAC